MHTGAFGCKLGSRASPFFSCGIDKDTDAVAFLSQGMSADSRGIGFSGKQGGAAYLDGGGRCMTSGGCDLDSLPR